MGLFDVAEFRSRLRGIYWFYNDPKLTIPGNASRSSFTLKIFCFTFFAYYNFGYSAASEVICFALVVLLSDYCKRGDMGMVEALLNEMKSTGIEPDNPHGIVELRFQRISKNGYNLSPNGLWTIGFDIVISGSFGAHCWPFSSSVFWYVSACTVKCSLSLALVGTDELLVVVLWCQPSYDITVVNIRVGLDKHPSTLIFVKATLCFDNDVCWRRLLYDIQSKLLWIKLLV
ncbi:pentatricopeptide repeat (PPR) superfamily protein, partial [Striga asiatica]